VDLLEHRFEPVVIGVGFCWDFIYICLIVIFESPMSVIDWMLWDFSNCSHW